MHGHTILKFEILFPLNTGTIFTLKKVFIMFIV